MNTLGLGKEPFEGAPAALGHHALPSKHLHPQINCPILSSLSFSCGNVPSLACTLKINVCMREYKVRASTVCVHHNVSAAACS